MTQDIGILTILERLAAGELDVQGVLLLAGGRSWYLPVVPKRDMAAIKEAIRRDPCRDYKILKRRYKVSVGTIYNAWNEKTG